MYEVRLHKQFMEGGLMLTADAIYHDDYDGMITCWFGEEIEWCKERNMNVITALDLENWTSPQDAMKAIVREGVYWPGPDVCFIFPDDKDAMLFRLRWA